MVVGKANCCSGSWDSCTAAKLAESFMLIEESSLTVVKTRENIPVHSRICNPSTKIEHGGVWLIFTRPSAVSAIAAETQLLDWSSAEMKMVDWVCLDLILPLLV